MSSSTENIRRGIPLVATGTDFYAKRATLSQRDLVSSLGLTGALSVAGLGPVLDAVEKTVDGLPVVGEPVGGLVHTVDDAVGLGTLLDPKPVAGAPPALKEKRQLDILSGLTGNLPPGLVGTLPIGSVLPSGGSTDPLAILGQLAALQGQLGGANPVNGQLASLLGQLKGATGNLPTPPAAPADTGALLSGLTVAQAEAYGLLPAGFVQAVESKIGAVPKARSPALSFIARLNQLVAANDLQHGRPTADDTMDPNPPADTGYNTTSTDSSSPSSTTTSSIYAATPLVAAANLPQPPLIPDGFPIPVVPTPPPSYNLLANNDGTAPVVVSAPPAPTPLPTASVVPTFSIASPAAVKSAMAEVQAKPSAIAQRDATPAEEPAAVAPAMAEEDPTNEDNEQGSAGAVDEEQDGDDSSSEYSDAESVGDEEGQEDGAESGDEQATTAPASGEDGSGDSSNSAEPVAPAQFIDTAKDAVEQEKYSVTSSSTMAETPSQAAATAEAVSPLPSS